MDFLASFDLNPETGSLEPKIYGVDIEMGESYIYHDNWFIRYLMHQFIGFGKVAV